MNYPSLITDQSVVLVKGNKRLIAGASHPNFSKIIDNIRNKRFNNIERLFDIKETLEKIFNITIKNNKEVFYKGKPINNVVTGKILNYVRNGLPYKPWAGFLDKLMENPEELCREQLFNYVERYGLPIDDMGFVYGWKIVKNDFYDWHTGKTHQYKIGSIVKMDRNKCDTAPTEGCGKGLHLGTMSYCKEFVFYCGRSQDQSKAVLVRFSPKDVMSCPEDCNWQKLRVCKLRVMREVKIADLFPLEDKYMGKNGKKVFKRSKNGRFA